MVPKVFWEPYVARVNPFFKRLLNQNGCSNHCCLQSIIELKQLHVAKFLLSPAAIKNNVYSGFYLYFLNSGLATSSAPFRGWAPNHIFLDECFTEIQRIILRSLLGSRFNEIQIVDHQQLFEPSPLLHTHVYSHSGD